MLDRIDIHAEVPAVDYEMLAGHTPGESSLAVRQRVEAARARQQQRLADTPLHCNADMGPAQIRQHCQLDSAGQALIKAAMRQLGLSARAYHRVLKLARTIADLDRADGIQAAHLAEALQYRQRSMLT